MAANQQARQHREDWLHIGNNALSHTFFNLASVGGAEVELLGRESDHQEQMFWLTLNSIVDFSGSSTRRYFI